MVKTSTDAAEFAAALAEFRGLIDAERIESQQPFGPAAIYTAAVTTWLLVYQRLHAGASPAEAVAELIRTDPQFLPDQRRVRERTLSANTGAYSRARQRLLPEVTEEVARHVFESLVSASPPSVAGRRVFLMDGTTIALAPSRALQRAFPPAANQYGASVWPIAHLLVAHELESGCAVLPEVGAKFGPEAVSEVGLAKALLTRLPARSIVIADRNFGVFSLIHSACEAGHDVLVRLTESRFQALRRQAEAIVGDDSRSLRWRLRWRPSLKDRRTNPQLPAEACLEATLHEVRVSENLTLRLLTTGDFPGDAAAALYARRREVETDIREIKVLLRTEHLAARSLPMLRKELAASIVAYNLVIQVRRLAARRIGVAPRRISFSGTWSAVRIILLESIGGSAADWERRFDLALRMAGQHKLPTRPGRSFPRRAHAKRNKSTSGKRPPSSQ